MSEEIDGYILRKYDIVEKLGKGAYGIVWKAIDKKTGRVVALKKNFDAFRDATDAQRAYREIMLLLQLRHENIIHLHNVLRADRDMDIYLVFEFMEADLHAVIRGAVLEDVHKQYVLYQLLKSLKYMHSAGVIHRDLKPANLLLDSECHLKVADFGLARLVGWPGGSDQDSSEGTVPVLTDYVATRWYRAPEILLGSTTYTKAVDMWSVGCILGEMLSETPVFPGTSTLNQLDRILAVTGRPSGKDVEDIHSPFVGSMLDAIPPKPPRPLKELFPHATMDALDLLRRLLVFNPSKRISAEEALRHPFISKFRDPGNESVCSSPVRLAFGDGAKHSASDYREKLYAMIRSRRDRQQNRGSAPETIPTGTPPRGGSPAVAGIPPKPSPALQSGTMQRPERARSLTEGGGAGRPAVRTVRREPVQTNPSQGVGRRRTSSNFGNR